MRQKVIEVVGVLEWFWHSLVDASPDMRLSANSKLDRAMSLLTSAGACVCTRGEREFLDRLRSPSDCERLLADNGLLKPKSEK